METRKTNHVVAVVGPTGSGKTALAVKLAKKFNGVLISADSRQVYRGLNIGTNKEGLTSQWHGQQSRNIDGIPQLLVDVVEPGQQFTLNNWLNSARALLSQIWTNNQLPIVVGGTGLYVTALTDGYRLGGGRMAKNNQPVDFISLFFQLEVDRQVLNERSDERYLKIFDALLTETKDLISTGVSPDWLEQIGLDYKYAAKHLSGVLAREDAIRLNQRASRQYIRRQLTWWRHHGQPNLVANPDQAEQLVLKFLDISNDN